MDKYYVHIYIEYSDTTKNIIENSLSITDISYENNYFKIILTSDNIISSIIDVRENIMIDSYKDSTITICPFKAASDANALRDLCTNMMKYYQKMQKPIITYNDYLIHIISSSSENIPFDYFRNTIFTEEFFNFLDDEIISTIDIFFQCNLNITDASQKLYIHRNTLIYRLDKILRITGYDIRKFNDAMIFKIAWLNKDRKS